MKKFSLFKLLFGISINDIKNLKQESEERKVCCDKFEDIYLFDFLNYSSRMNSGELETIPSGNINEVDNEIQKPLKIRIKPIDVLNELEVIPTPFSLSLIDEKISVLKDKENLINQNYAKREITSLIERLENRKKYVENKLFFDQFQNTNDENINKLLQKYDLVMKSSDIFIPEFPDDAIKIMKDYTEMCEKICSKKPVFYVIAEPDKFKAAWDKRDPILLVQSPFGFYWQILGAWDREMLLLGEL